MANPQPIGPFESIQDLQDKIDNEGGLEYFLTCYMSADDFIGSPIEAEAREYVKAHSALMAKLKALGYKSFWG